MLLNLYIVKEVLEMSDSYYIPREAIRRMIKEAGAERVGDDAVTELGRVLEQIANDISQSAIVLAGHSGKKTVKGKDISLAASTTGHKVIKQ